MGKPSTLVVLSMIFTVGWAKEEPACKADGTCQESDDGAFVQVRKANTTRDECYPSVLCNSIQPPMDYSQPYCCWYSWNSGADINCNDCKCCSTNQEWAQCNGQPASQCGSPHPNPGKQCNNHQDGDCEGANMQGMPNGQNMDWQACQTKCQETRDCWAWTWVPATTTASGIQECWLKYNGGSSWNHDYPGKVSGTCNTR